VTASVSNPGTSSPRRWVALDFETATSRRASACSLGLVVIEDEEIADLRGWLIKPPGNEYDAMNIRIHGIAPDTTRRSPEFDEVWAEVLPYLKGATLLAHSAQFDMGVLRASLQHYGLRVPPADYHCTVLMARRVWPDLHRHTLDRVCDHCGIELRHHDATSDAMACASVALRCRRETGADTLDTLVDTLGLHAKAL
jgi:DNA polymerase-3 subunit epsilon